MFFTIPENSSNSNTVQVKSFKGQPPPRHYISLFGRLCASIRSRKSRDRSSWTFPRRDSGENLSREFHGSRHDWHDVPTVILRRETLMVATPSRRAITCPGSILQRVSAGLYSEFVLSNFQLLRTPYGFQAGFPPDDITFPLATNDGLVDRQNEKKIKRISPVDRPGVLFYFWLYRSF